MQLIAMNIEEFLISDFTRNIETIVKIKVHAAILIKRFLIF
jgi:hypothetical protein